MELNIVVCIKGVMEGPRPSRGGRAVPEISLNLFDRPAIAMAKALVLRHGGRITLVSMGPEGAAAALYEALSMGADQAILVSDPLFRGSDTLITSRILAAAVRKIGAVDLLLFGTRSADSDTGHVGPQTAQILSFPFVSHVHELTMDEALDPPSGEIQAVRCADGFQEEFWMKGPAAVSVVSRNGGADHTALQEIEYTFEHKKITCWDHKDLQLAPQETGVDASPTRMVAEHPKDRKKQCRFIQGNVEQAADTLAQTLSQAGLVD